MCENKELAAKMIDFRANNHISQKELANMCGLTVQTINSVENGRQRPSRLTCRIIENVVEKEVK